MITKWAKEQMHPCEDCGKLVWYKAIRCVSCAIKRRWRDDGDLRRRKYCCQEGELNPSWKGGRIKDKDGYILIKNRSHHRTKSNGYVLEHILVWEQANSKLLPKGWVIHHLNGIKDDNRSENLVAFPNKKHCLLLQAKAKRIQKLEALLNNQHQLL